MQQFCCIGSGLLKMALLLLNHIICESIGILRWNHNWWKKKTNSRAKIEKCIILYLQIIVKDTCLISIMFWFNWSYIEDTLINNIGCLNIYTNGLSRIWGSWYHLGKLWSHFFLHQYWLIWKFNLVFYWNSSHNKIWRKKVLY